MEKEKKIPSGLSYFAKWVFCILVTGVVSLSCNRTGIEDSSGPPEVISTNPLNNAEGVSLDAMLTATFSEEMDTTTLNTTSFNVTSNSSAIPGIVTVTGTTATFIPLNPLLDDRSYVATITTDAADALGFRMKENYVWRFSTDTDETGPANLEVLSTNPPDGSVNINLSPLITAQFSDVMNPSTLNSETFILREGTNPVEGSVNVSDSTATFIPDGGLSYGSTYTATITSEAESAGGNSLSASYSWSFTTMESPDGSPPVINSTDPPDEAEDVEINTTVSATFSEDMNPSTINPRTFSLRQGGDMVDGSVNYSDRTAVLTPDENLEFGENYTARITNDVEDAAGNNLSGELEWRFSTMREPDDESPEIVSMEPEDGDESVEITASISVTFSEPMNPATISGSTFFVEEDGPGNSRRSVIGFVDYSGETATFNPFGFLENDQTYHATITAEVEDINGNAMDEEVEWTFRTGDDDDD